MSFGLAGVEMSLLVSSVRPSINRPEQWHVHGVGDRALISISKGLADVVIVASA